MGILVTIVVTGALNSSAGPATVSATSTPVPVTPGTSATNSLLFDRVRRLVLQRLGPSASGQKTARLVSLRINDVRSSYLGTPVTAVRAGYKSISIVFRLYDHPLGRGWRLRAAKGDVFSVMKALFTSSIPVFDVSMTGTFPLKVGRDMRERNALWVYLNHSTSTRIPWALWDRPDETRLWSKLTYKRVDNQFA